MCEIIRGENGGDLTYFIEYYLELLVRALDAKKERDRREEEEKNERMKTEQEETLAQERRLALEPLVTGEATKTESGADRCDGKDAVEIASDGYEIPTAEEPTVEIRPTESPPVVSRAAYIEKIHALRMTGRHPQIMVQKMDALLRFMDRGVKRFTAADYQRETGVGGKGPYEACHYYYEKGLVTREKIHGVYRYTMAYRDAEEETEDTTAQCAELKEILPDGTAPQLPMEPQKKGRPPLIPRVIEAIERMKADGSEEFCCDGLCEEIDITKKQAYDVCRLLLEKGWIEALNAYHPKRYRLTMGATAIPEAGVCPKQESLGDSIRTESRLAIEEKEAEKAGVNEVPVAFPRSYGMSYAAAAPTRAIAAMSV